MTKKDVELRLKARDDASKNVNKVSAALKSIAGDADKAAKGAGKTGAALGGLAADVARLQAEASKLKSFGTIASQLDKSTAAVERSERALKGAQGDFARLASESKVATEAVKGLAAAEATLQAQLDATKARQKAIADQQAANTAAVNKAREARRLYNEELKKTPTKERTPAQIATGEAVRTSVTNAESTRRSYLDSVTQESAALRTESKRLGDELKVLGTQSAASAREQNNLAKQLEGAGNALLRARADAADNWRELERIDNAAVKASASLGGLAIRQEDIARASQRSADQILRTQRALEAYNKFATGSGDVADPKTAAIFQRQNAVVREAKNDLAALREETARLATGLNGVSGNATEQVNAFKRMAAATREAEAEVEKQIVAMNRLRGVSQGGGFGAWARATIPIQQTTAAITTAGNETKKLTAEQGKLAPAIQRTSGAMSGAATGANAMGSAIRKSASDKRQALSITQRLRGEVLALATAYLGLQSALGGITQSIAAFRSLEAVQSRLGAVFAQDTAKVAAEVDFLRGQADRLGISFSTLGEQYGKFAIAANAANFSAENTRSIFLSVAEAGRVNKLSLDQLQGTFLAIEQIISKGKFTSEEVRRQLGDRLPGAFNILADAMGVTTAELDKMMSQGDLLATESNLLKFADEMSRRFGPQLSSSLDTVSTDIGRFENSIFKIQLALANGFIPELRSALQAFNNFANSADGARTFSELGALVGRFIRVLAEVPKYFDLITLAAKAFGAIKLGQAFTSMAARALETRKAFVSFSSTVVAIGPQMADVARAQSVLGAGFVQVTGAVDRYRARLLASTATTGVARAGTQAFAATLGVLRGAMILTANVARTMWAAIGGLPGIIATGLVLAIGSWATGIDSATAALVEHDRQLAALRETYQSVGDAAKDWYESVNGVTLSQAVRSTDELRAAYDKARGSLEAYSRLALAWFSDFPAETPERKQADELVRLSKEFASGERSIEDYRDALEAIALSPVNDDLKSIADGLLDMLSASEDGGQSLDQMRKALEVSEAKLRLMSGTATRADKVLLGLVQTVDEVADTFDRSAAVQTYTDAIDKLKEAIPELADEMERLKDITDLNKTAWEGMVAAWNAGDYGKIGEIIGLLGRGIAGINLGALDDEIKAMGSGSSVTSNLIKQFEGFISTPKWDENAFRAGYGSDEVTLSDGTIVAITEGMTVNLADAERDLARRIVEFQKTVKTQIGEDRFASFNDAQQAVLTSIAYNYGSLPDRIISAVMGGDAGAISNAIRGLAGDNNGVNATRREKEALIFQRGGNADGGALIDAAADRAKELADQVAATKERIAQTDFEISQQKLINDGKNKQAAIEEAIRAAKAENPAITSEQLAQIEAQTAALYDQQNARAGLEAAEERVNQLYQLRQQLLEQQKMAEESGDFNQVASLKEQIAGLNEQTALAIQQAVAMWQAIGGPEADAAIAKLQTMGMTLQHNSDKILAFGMNAQQISTLVGSFVDGMVGIFDKMAEAIANGEDAFHAVGVAFLQFAADFLRQIATMILKQMLLNALTGFGGPIGQAAAGLGGIAGHTGGMVGSAAIGGGNRIGARPAWIESAFTYHTGGLAGFKPDEVSATLKRNEEILTEEDPRHRFNQGGEKQSGGGRGLGIKQVLAIGDDEIANAMGGSAGEHVTMTHLKRNVATIKQMLK